jgi:hypothetical protein
VVEDLVALGTERAHSSLALYLLACHAHEVLRKFLDPSLGQLWEGMNGLGHLCLSRHTQGMVKSGGLCPWDTPTAGCLGWL